MGAQGKFYNPILLFQSSALGYRVHRGSLLPTEPLLVCTSFAEELMVHKITIWAVQRPFARTTSKPTLDLTKCYLEMGESITEEVALELHLEG